MSQQFIDTIFTQTESGLRQDFKKEGIKIITQLKALVQYLEIRLNQIDNEKDQINEAPQEVNQEANQEANEEPINEVVQIKKVEENVVQVTKKQRKPRKKRVNEPIESLTNLSDSSELKPYKTGELRAFLTTKTLSVEGKKPVLMERVFKAIMKPDELTEEDKKVKIKRKRGKKKTKAEPKPKLVENADDKTEDEEEELVGKLTNEQLDLIGNGIIDTLQNPIAKLFEDDLEANGNDTTDDETEDED